MQLGGVAAIVVCLGAVFAAAAPAFADAQQSLQPPTWAQQSWGQQSWLYPPEVPFRAVVVVDDPSLQRRYWDPRFCDCACLPGRHFSCARPGAWR
jgi:hypothetical protein